MAIGTYDELQAAIKLWMAEPDFADARLEEMIALAEGELRSLVKDIEMEVRSQATLSGEYLNLPDDFAEKRSIHIEASADKSLTYVTPQWMQSRNFTAGVPKYYTITDGQFKFAPFNSTSRTVELIYLQKFVSLSDSATTNWLLTNHPNIYFWGALFYGNVFIADDSRAKDAELKFSKSIVALERFSIAKRHGGGPLVPRARVCEVV